MGVLLDDNHVFNRRPKEMERCPPIPLHDVFPVTVDYHHAF